uniref:Uncharacterized protein n=1 Tax=Romanomermis culicivorax TaxID=13658 RepID=A0A915KRU6_ROMCU
MTSLFERHDQIMQDIKTNNNITDQFLAQDAMTTEKSPKNQEEEQYARNYEVNEKGKKENKEDKA